MQTAKMQDFGRCDCDSKILSKPDQYYNYQMIFVEREYQKTA
jgi:hypothetical protein